MMEKKLSISVAVISSVIVSIPLLKLILSGEIPIGDDLNFHLGRMRSIAMELPYHFPVYMFSDWLKGLGVPAAIFYPSLFFYFPAILLVLKFPISFVYDGFLILLVIFTGIFSYFGFKRILKSDFLGGVAASIYVAQGYFLHDLFARAAIGEVLAMCFIPLAISIPRKNILEAILIFSAILESHILTAIILLPILFIKHRFNWKIVLGIFGLNSFFIIPFIDQYFSVDPMIKTIHADSLIESAWKISSEEFLKSIGFVGFLTLLGSFFGRGKIFWTSFGLSIFFAWLSTDLFPWQIVENFLPSIKTIQFPWRFMMFYSLCSSIAAAIILEKFFHNHELILGFCIVNAFINSNPQIKTLEKIPPEILYVDYASSRIGWDQFYAWRDGIEPLVDSKITNIEHRRGKTIIQFKDAHGYLTLPILFYDGYEVRDEFGKKLPIHESPKHLIEVEIRSGSKIEVEYRGLILFDVATTISLATSILFLWRWKKCRSE